MKIIGKSWSTMWEHIDVLWYIWLEYIFVLVRRDFTQYSLKCLEGRTYYLHNKKHSQIIKNKCSFDELRKYFVKKDHMKVNCTR